MKKDNLTHNDSEEQDQGGLCGRGPEDLEGDWAGSGKDILIRNTSLVQGPDIEDDGALQPVTHETQVKGKLVSELHSHSHLKEQDIKREEM